MRRIGLIICIGLTLLLSCQNQGQAVQTQAVQTQTAQAPSVQTQPPGGAGGATQIQQEPGKNETNNSAFPPPSQVFDPSSISQEEKDTTKTEIQNLIQRLNGIIRARNYNAWVSYLSSGYFATINSAEYLDRVSKSTVLVKQKIVLKSAQDYFNHVVVPARTNDRVDDIEFESQNRVKAYTLNAKGEKLRLYDLEKFGEEWKIIN